MREGLSHKAASELASIENEQILLNILQIIRHLKNVDVMELTPEEIQYFALLVEEDLKAYKQAEQRDR